MWFLWPGNVSLRNKSESPPLMHFSRAAERRTARVPVSSLALSACDLQNSGFLEGWIQNQHLPLEIINVIIFPSHKYLGNALSQSVRAAITKIP